MKYLFTIIKHKWFVLLAGLRMKAPLWRLIIHDWSKFTPSEFFAYRRYFCGDGKNKEEFERAWHRHLKRNPHHWEHWFSTSSEERFSVQGHGDGYQCWVWDTYMDMQIGPECEDDLTDQSDAYLVKSFLNNMPTPIPMPEWAVREMVADWLGASRSYEGYWPDMKKWDWWEKNHARVIQNIHPKTKEQLLIVMQELGVSRGVDSPLPDGSEHAGSEGGGN